MATDYTFNVLKHDLVPEHRLLSLDEEKRVLEEKGITKDKLPKIRKNDPGIKALENTAEARAILGPQDSIEEGRVIELVRKSETAHRFVGYRLVTRG